MEIWKNSWRDCTVWVCMGVWAVAGPKRLWLTHLKSKKTKLCFGRRWPWDGNFGVSFLTQRDQIPAEGVICFPISPLVNVSPTATLSLQSGEWLLSCRPGRSQTACARHYHLHNSVSSPRTFCLCCNRQVASNSCPLATKFRGNTTVGKTANLQFSAIAQSRDFSTQPHKNSAWKTSKMTYRMTSDNHKQRT